MFHFQIKGYQSDGSGNVLSKEALWRLYHGILSNHSNCQVKLETNEDIHIANCLSSQGVYQGKSTDEYHRQRFHPLYFRNHFHGNIPQ
jgi:hypothetical protein